MKRSNALISESSPYLLQHAYNPVQWHPWSQNILAEAQQHNKLLLISIGYAACHWCHVMEHESFENEDVALVMNANYINIKIDREERPDLDQIYMDALQLMTGQGGWPLNIVALPNGKPVWGGTYFKKEDWISVLQQIANLYKDNPEKVKEYAANLEEGIKQLNEIIPNKSQDFPNDILEKILHKWQSHFDLNYGGAKGAPKFMMPVNLQFLMRYAHQTENKNLLDYVDLSLEKMANGGIYDHVGGGFSRYSVDNKWHVPHFEKMLYDNAQLITLYANAYKRAPNKLYKNVIEDTISFIERELTNNEGLCYSSLDADSLNNKKHLKEGAFYTWTKEELQELLDDDFSIFSDYFNINHFGYWEEQQYVLIKTKSVNEIAEIHHITTLECENIIKHCKKKLFKYREQRNKPRLDDKTLTSWNAMMVEAYITTSQALQNNTYLQKAELLAEKLILKTTNTEGGLFHNYKNGKATISGFLEDYAFLSKATFLLHQATGNEKWLSQTKTLVNYCFDHFYDNSSGLFYFTNNTEEVIITRKFEKSDNVIPASNSVMANLLFELAKHTNNTAYENAAKKMTFTVLNDSFQYPYSHANWLNAILNYSENFYEIAIAGPKAKEKYNKLTSIYLPNCTFAYHSKESVLPLLKDRFNAEKTYIYVCKNNQCNLPVTKKNDVLILLKN
ncbi:thioredoxin domain-containing protein [Zhouia sp. PK063]|uniref:thioredoxin domain-containing protein n=1 Tax=Zhouia sp. PK063 TaxID=3373602 RepID=UPI0037AE3455